MATPDTRPPLEYTTQPPSRRRWLRLFVALLIVGVLAAAGWLLRGAIERKLARRAYERQAAAWYAKNATRVQPSTRLIHSDLAQDQPAPSDPVLDATPGYTDAGPVLGSHPSPDPSVYRGERVNSIGQKRLLAISFKGWAGTKIEFATEQIGPLEAGPDKGMIHLLKRSFRELDLAGVASNGDLRLFAGQSDPNDPARFWIPFTAGPRRGRIVGTFSPGPSASADPAGAKVEAEMNADVKWEVAVDHADPTTAPARE